MKLKISHLLLVVFITLFSACSSDDDPKLTENNLAEETPIAKEKVFDNIIVEGATKKAGAPNTPNEQVSFTLNKNNTSAVLIDGFDIAFNSNDNITGAYLQIKDTEGNIADGYYDIDLSLVGNKRQGIKSKKRITSIDQLLRQTKQKNTKASTNKIVDIDFNAAIEPGTFCYEVRVYDANGNISAPQEVCVTVQSWGGNDTLVGKWNYTKTDEFEDGDLKTINVGVEDCYERTTGCSNNQTLTYSVCYSTDSFEFTINSDSTYVYVIKSTDKDIDSSTIDSTNCQAAQKIEKEHFISKGMWAYDQVKEEIIIVETQSTDIDENGVEDTENYDAGNAEVVVLKSVVNGNSLILTEEYLSSDGTVDEYYKYYYDKE